MNRKIIVILMISIVVGIGILVWFWRRSTSNPVVSMGVEVILETGTVQSASVANNTVTFHMQPNARGNFTYSVWNNGTVTLRDVYFQILNVSNGLTLVASNHTLSIPDTTFLGVLFERDSESRGPFTILAPAASGDYEMQFRVTSDEIKNDFRVMITVP